MVSVATQHLALQQLITHVKHLDQAYTTMLLRKFRSPAITVRLDNLIALVDRNSLQISGPTAEIMDIEPLVEKWKSFNWLVDEINGHHMGEVITSVKRAMNNKGKPTVIIAHTIKGKGVSFMENQAAWHYRAPTLKETKQALEELEQRQRGEV